MFDERDPAALRALIGWKSAQYRRTGRRDRFAQEWITRLVGRLAGTGAPECSGHAVRPVRRGPSRRGPLGLRSASVLACWFPASTPEFAKFSPGLVLHLRMAEAAAGEGIGLPTWAAGQAESRTR
ncbi:GNAT family N-acetyltransferase [Streptomyces hirsutus]